MKPDIGKNLQAVLEQAFCAAKRAGRDPKTGEEHFPALELVRLAIPRMVYTNEHLAYVAAGIAKTWKRRKRIRGLKVVFEPEFLRFFQARFEKVS